MPAERRVMLDSADKVAAFAKEMSELLQTSEITETRAFVPSFVKAIMVKRGRATIHYTIPTPPDNSIGGAAVAEVALSRRVFKQSAHAPVARLPVEPVGVERRLRDGVGIAALRPHHLPALVGGGPRGQPRRAEATRSRPWVPRAAQAGRPHCARTSQSKRPSATIAQGCAAPSRPSPSTGLGPGSDWNLGVTPGSMARPASQRTRPPAVSGTTTMRAKREGDGKPRPPA